jgi:predicted acylesterase/phospholipase RssA
MSEFDQEDGGRKWCADHGVNLWQSNVVAAEHRASRATAERHTGDNDCLGQLTDPKSRRAVSDCAEQHNVGPPSYEKKIGLVLQGGGALGSYQAGVYGAVCT